MDLITLISRFAFFLTNWLKEVPHESHLFRRWTRTQVWNLTGMIKNDQTSYFSSFLPWIQFVASWGLMLDLDGVKPSKWAFMWKSLTAYWLYGCDPASTDIIAVQPARCECGQACVKQMWYNRKWVFLKALRKNCDVFLAIKEHNQSH